MCGKNCKKVCMGMKIAKILVVIGGINWGLVGLGMLLGKSVEAWNLIHAIFSSMPALEGIIYVLVGIAAVMKIFGCKCHKCMMAGADGKCDKCMNGTCDTHGPAEQKM